MAGKKKFKASEDGVLRDATDDEAANLERIQADSQANNPPKPEAAE